MKGHPGMRQMSQEEMVVVLRWLEGWKNDSADLRAPQVKTSMTSLYPGLLVLYSLVLVGAAVLNIVLIYTVLRHKLYNLGLLLSLAISNLLLSCFVLPPTVAVLFLHNWLLGRSFCHLLPLIQDMFIYVTILTHLMIIVDRYRLMRGLSRISATVTSLGVWLLSLCLVLPYQPYIIYIDLEKYMGPQFHRVGICTASITGFVKQYTRGLVQVMYFVPVCMMSCLYLRMHRDLQRRQMYWDVVYETRTSLDSVSSPTTCSGRANRDITLQERRYQDNQLTREKLLQQGLGVMAALCSVCLCPLMVLRLAKTSILESHENSGHFEILYSVFILFAFLPTVASPLTFLYWYMESTGTINIQQRLSHRHLFDTECRSDADGSRCHRSREIPAGLLSCQGNNLIRETCIQ